MLFSRFVTEAKNLKLLDESHCFCDNIAIVIIISLGNNKTNDRNMDN